MRYFLFSILIVFVLGCGNETDSGLQNALDTGRMTKDIKEADAYTAPKGSLIINSGVVATNKTDVSLHLSARDAVGVTGYYVSNTSETPLVTNSTWKSVTSTDQFSKQVSDNISAVEQSNSFYAWFRDAVGGISERTQASIIYDVTAPANPSVSINSGVSTATSRIVTLTLSATDSVGVTGYYASESNGTPASNASGWSSVTSATGYSANVSFTLSSGNASKTVYVWFKDAAGNISPIANDNITTKIEAVTINGLEWQLETAPGTYTWYSADSYCSNLDLSLHQDWRLPTIDELFALVDTSVSAPKIVAELRDYTQSSKYTYYWSSTMYSKNSYYPLVVSYYYGLRYYDDEGKSDKNYVRCVR